MPGSEEFEESELRPELLPERAATEHGASRQGRLPAAANEEGTRAIWRLAWPVTSGLVLSNAVLLIDAAMVGELGPTALAAVGYATQFQSLAQSVLFAVGSGCIALMARAIGASDSQRARYAFAASLGVALLAALAVTGAVLAAPGLWLDGLAAEPEVRDLTIPYLQLALASTLPLALAMMIENAMRANRDTRTPLWIAGAIALLKLVLNGLLIFGAGPFPRLELVGAGFATLISQTIGLMLFVLVLRGAPRDGPLALRWRDFRGAGELVRAVVRLSVPGVGERLAMNLGLLVYFRVLAEYGSVAIAAYSVGVRLLAFSWLPGSGIGAAASALVGQALGAGRRESAFRVGVDATRLAVLVALVLGIACAAFHDPIARLFTDDEATLDALVPFLLCLALAQPFLQAHFALGGVHRGAGDTITPFLAATAGNWIFRLPLAALFTYGLGLGLVWVWYAIIFDHLTRMLWLGWSFRRRRWLDVRG